MQARALVSISLAVVFVGCGQSEPLSSHPTTPPPPTTLPRVDSAPVTDTASPSAPPSALPAATASAAVTPASNGCPTGMIRVKGGSYKFGFLKKETAVDELCVDRTEVTSSAYAACVKAGKCTDSFLDCAEAKTYGIAGKENFPIVCIDFTQATSYCEFVAKRLPTEPEWEWVARAGDEGRKFAFGNDAPKDNVCWSGSSTGARKGPCEVGAFPQSNSPDGLVDLTGNVFEWTSSSADGTKKMYVTKGGTWRDGVAAQLVSSRPGGFKPEYRCGFGGVRCVAPATK